MLALPLARIAADEHERGRTPKPRLRLRVRPDQERQSLDLREAPHVHQHDAVPERGQVAL